jgi:hypothetical protein
MAIRIPGLPCAEQKGEKGERHARPKVACSKSAGGEMEHRTEDDETATVEHSLPMGAASPNKEIPLTHLSSCNSWESGMTLFLRHWSPSEMLSSIEVCDPLVLTKPIIP